MDENKDTKEHPKVSPLPTTEKVMQILNSMATNKELVLDLIDYVLPKILTTWWNSPHVRGAVNLIFDSVSDIQRIIQEHKLKPLKEIRFSVSVGFNSLDSLKNNPLLGKDGGQDAFLNSRTFATLGLSIDDGFLTFTITEFKVRDNKLVRE